MRKIFPDAGTTFRQICRLLYIYPPVHPAVKKPSSSKLTKSGRDILKKHPHSFGSLDIAISEAVKDAGGHVEKLCISPECG